MPLLIPIVKVKRLNKINQEHIIGIVCVVVGTVVILLAGTFPKGAASSMQLTGPAFFPNLLAIVLILLGVYQIIIGFANKGSYPGYSARKLVNEFKKPKSITVLVIIGMFIFFIMFLKMLGFFITSFLFLLVLQWQLRIIWWKNLVTSAVFLGIIYLIFVEVFTISLPPGILF